MRSQEQIFISSSMYKYRGLRPLTEGILPPALRFFLIALVSLMEVIQLVHLYYLKADSNAYA